MKKWQADKTPKHTLMLKYLRMILTPKEFKVLIKRYCEAKAKHLEEIAAKKHD